ncbi:MAG: class I SAM-dependent methyltransferase [Planctomycetota bacterium]
MSTATKRKPGHRDFDWYAEPLYYDIVFDSDTPKEADFLEAVAAKWARSPGKRCLEPACGTGRLVAELAARGWDATGFDLEPAMVQFARRRAKEKGVRKGCRIEPGDMTKFKLPGPKPEGARGAAGYDLAFCLVSTSRLLPSDEAMIDHLRCTAKHLAPGGVYVLGLHITDYTDLDGGYERWVAKRGDLRVSCIIESDPCDRKARTEAVRCRIRAVHGDAEPKLLESRWTFRTYGITQLRRVVKAATELKHVATYEFSHDIHTPVRLGGDDLGVVLVLRKK